MDHETVLTNNNSVTKIILGVIALDFKLQASSI